MNQEVRELILAGEFKKAYSQINSSNIKNLRDFILTEAFDKGSITFYGFVCYLILLDEKASLHDLATDVLAYPLSYFEGAYPTALFHARRALELDPQNLEYLKFLLFFHDIPDKLIKKEEAIEIAREVLKRDPDHKIAQDTLKKYDQKIET